MPTKDAPPPPKTPHVTPSTFYCAGGFAELSSERVCATTKQNNSTTHCARAITQPSSHFLSWEQRALLWGHQKRHN
jgi:hypothetical protein